PNPSEVGPGGRLGRPVPGRDELSTDLPAITGAGSSNDDLPLGSIDAARRCPGSFALPGSSLRPETHLSSISCLHRALSRNPALTAASGHLFRSSIARPGLSRLAGGDSRSDSELCGL